MEPPATEREDADADALNGSASAAACVRFSHRGYIQALDGNGLIQLAALHDLVVRLECGPGDYVSTGDVLARVWPAGRVTLRLSRAINHRVVLGWERTQLQDHEYHLNQLVEIAVRALSPAINDPFTAMQCIDRLTEALRGFARLDRPSPYRYDGAGRLRVVTTDVQTFAGLTSICFDKIRCYGQSSVDVTIRLLDALASIATWTRHPADLAVIERHAVMLERGSRTAIAEEWDRDRIAERFKRVIAAIESTPVSSASLRATAM
jgi:uncharacterized membrane protein